MARKNPSAKKTTSGIGPIVPIWLAILLAIFGGCLIFLSFPTFDIFPLSFFGVAMMLLAIRGRGAAAGFWLGLLTGFVTNLGGFYWISYMLREFAHMTVWLSWVITCMMVAVQGLVYAIPAAISSGFANRFPKLPWMLFFPVIFTAVEYLFPLIFPWYLANGQQKFTALIQMADITGAAGITFLIILVNCSIADIAARRISGAGFPAVSVAVASVALVAALAYGMFRIDQIDQRMEAAPKLKVGMVEADIGIWEKEARNQDGSPLDGAGQMAMLYSNLLKHQYLSQTLEREHKPDLIVWPESSYFPLYQVFSRRNPASLLAVTAGGSLVGVTDSSATVDAESSKVFRDSGLTAISAQNEENILAVGPRGAIYKFDGVKYLREESGTDRNLNAVAWSFDDGSAMAVGDNGVVLLRELDQDSKASWKVVDTGRNFTLRGVVKTPKYGWVACGDNGSLISIDDGRVRSLVPDGLPDLTAVTWSDKLGVVAVGHQGAIVTMSGPNEVKMEQPSKKTLRAVWADSLIWAVGDDGLVVLCDSTCHTVKSGVRRTLNAIGYMGRGSVVAGGLDGILLELSQDKGPRRIEGASGRITGITDLPFVEGYPFPTDVKKIYVSRTPLPQEGSAGDLLPAYESDRKRPPAERNSVMRGFSTPMIFGAATQERFPAPGKAPVRHNTAIMMDGSGQVLGTYFKNRLLIFGEYIPLEGLFPIFRKWLPEAGDWTPGDGPALFALGDAKIGISICYEGLLAGFHRKLAALEPNVYVNITNDAWFGRTHEPWLHLQLAELRAVEARTPMVRSTNTGISAFVDAVGRRTAHTAIEGAEVLVGEVALTSEKTIYVRYGDVFAWACCGIAAIMILALAAGRRRRA